MRAPSAWLLGCCCLTSLGCSQAPTSAPASKPEPSQFAAVDAGDWARRVAPIDAVSATEGRSSRSAVHAAVTPDRSEDSDALLTAGRLVYRVRFTIPPAFRGPRTGLETPAGELQVDVSLDRLRARFVGPGWPVEEGSEVRLRSDLLGVYLFDGRGGRSLGAGQLAGWFEGREAQPVQARVGLRREYGPHADQPIPGELLCALLVEWGNQDREALRHRCTIGALPPGFRVGPWSGELTAVVPLSLRRRELRADEIDPPAQLVHRTGASLLEAAAFARLVPARRLPGAAQSASLHVTNQTDTRAIVLVQGVPVGWVDAGQSLRIDGFTPGYYRVGAIRPLGVLRMPPRSVRIPGDLVIGRVRTLADEPR